eukprot:g534.t1
MSVTSNLSQLLRSGRKVVCVGKNYDKHITELAHLQPKVWDRTKEKDPVIFLKPTTSYAFQGEPVVLPKSPPFYGEVHHEVELGVLIGERAKNVDGDDNHCLSYIAGYVVAIDMTAREVQTAAKEKGLPWSVAKGYDSFLPVSEPVSVRSIGNRWDELTLKLSVNGDVKQKGKTGDMIHSIPNLIRYVSSIMTLEPGDLLITGTPEGVGPVFAGDVIHAGIEGHCNLEVNVI